MAESEQSAVDSKPGVFVVVEGGDGAGKTTLAQALRAELLARGAAVTMTEEPSPGPVGVLVRQLLVTGPLPAEAMALLFAADRAHHVEAVIRPALARGEVVMCSRYVLSSLAYQGPQVGFARVLELNARALAPDLVLFLDCDPHRGLRRVRATRAPDAFEMPVVARRAADGYARGLACLAGQGQRVARVDASQDAGAVLRAALAHVLPLVARHASALHGPGSREGEQAMDKAQQLVERFRAVLTKDWEAGARDGTPLVSRLSSAVICTRHFSMGEEVGVVAELLRIAAEVTGIPQETMTGSQGQPVVVWRPARGELFLRNDVNDVAPAHWTPAPPGFPE